MGDHPYNSSNSSHMFIRSPNGCVSGVKLLEIFINSIFPATRGHLAVISVVIAGVGSPVFAKFVHILIIRDRTRSVDEPGITGAGMLVILNK